MRPEDDFRLPEQPEPQSFSSAGQLLMNYLAVMNGTGDDTEEEYKTAVEALRERAGDVIIEIARLEQSCHLSDYPKRWSLIYAASELQNPVALPLFRSIVLTPIPPERSTDPHSFSTVAEETIIRTTAVDAVAQLAQQGDRFAIELLFDFLSVDSLSVKRAAVQGLLNVQQGENLRGRIEEQLCPEDRFLLDIRPIDINKVTQIDKPEDDLAEVDAEVEKAVSPDLPDRQRKSRTAKKRTSDDAPSY
jgi:HEAT repeat protein